MPPAFIYQHLRTFDITQFLNQRLTCLPDRHIHAGCLCRVMVYANSILAQIIKYLSVFVVTTAPFSFFYITIIILTSWNTSRSITYITQITEREGSCRMDKHWCEDSELTAAPVLLSDQLRHLQTARQLLVQCPPPSHLEKTACAPSTRDEGDIFTGKGEDALCWQEVARTENTFTGILKAA